MKSPTPTSPKAHVAFTLIELLVVISIIAILASLLFPAIGSVREAARKASAKNDVTQIVTAVKAYYTEYGKYPISTSGTTDAFFGPGAAVPTALSGTATYAGNTALLIDVLRNNTTGTNSATVTTLNPRQIPFVDPPTVKNTSVPTSGVTTSGSNIGCWFDPWGSQYSVLIDANYDNAVANPYSSPAPGGATLTTGVISWAWGKNGALGGGPAGAGFTKEDGTQGYFYSTPSNSSSSSSGDVISWQ